MTARPVRIVQVGCGDIATTGHLPAIERCSDVELVGVVDLVPDQGDRMGRRYGVPAWADLACALSAEPEAAVVAVPPQAAPTLTIAAIQAGLDVLCEKPMAVDLISAERVRMAGSRSDCVVQIGFKNRFSPLVEAVHDWLRDGRIGAPVVYTLGGFDESYDPSDALHFGRIQNFLASGPSFLHEGAHLADYLTYLSGARPTSVQACGVRSRAQFRSENFVSALIGYENGDLARMEIGWLFPASPRGEFRILGPSGVAMVNRAEQTASLSTRDGKGVLETEEVSLQRSWNDECFDRQLIHFVDCIRRRATPGPSIAAGLRSLRVGCAVMESMRDGKVVHL